MRVNLKLKLVRVRTDLESCTERKPSCMLFDGYTLKIEYSRWF